MSRRDSLTPLSSHSADRASRRRYDFLEHERVLQAPVALSSPSPTCGAGKLASSWQRSVGVRRTCFSPPCHPAADRCPFVEDGEPPPSCGVVSLREKR